MTTHQPAGNDTPNSPVFDIYIRPTNETTQILHILTSDPRVPQIYPDSAHTRASNLKNLPGPEVVHIGWFSGVLAIATLAELAGGMAAVCQHH